MYTSSFVSFILFFSLLSNLSFVFSLPVDEEHKPVEIVRLLDDGSILRRSVPWGVAYAGRPDNATESWFYEVEEDEDEFESLSIREPPEDDEELELVERALPNKPKKAIPPKKPPPPKKPAASATPPPKLAAAPKVTRAIYSLDCNSVPEVCSNICFYQFCKKRSTSMTVKAGRVGSVAPRCTGVNKCSTRFTGSGTPLSGAPAFSGGPPSRGLGGSGFQCDEFPLAATVEAQSGRADPATRCVPSRQNSVAGGKFKFAVGTKVTTQLINMNRVPFFCNKVCRRPDDVDGRQE